MYEFWRKSIWFDGFWCYFLKLKNIFLIRQKSLLEVSSRGVGWRDDWFDLSQSENWRAAAGEGDGEMDFAGWVIGDFGCDSSSQLESALLVFEMLSQSDRSISCCRALGLGVSQSDNVLSRFESRDINSPCRADGLGVSQSLNDLWPKKSKFKIWRKSAEKMKKIKNVFWRILSWTALSGLG